MQCSSSDKRSTESPNSDMDFPSHVVPNPRPGRPSLASAVSQAADWFKWLPPLYSSCPDPSVPNQKLCISAIVCPDRNGICLSAVDFNGGCYSVILSHMELERIKPAQMTIPNFFSSMGKQFVEQTFRVYRSGAKVMLILKDDVCFSLRHNEDTWTWTMVFNVLESVTLRTAEDPSFCTSDLTLQLQQLKKHVTQLEQRKEELRGTITQCEEEERDHLQKHAALQNELVATTQKYHKICEARGIDPKDFEGPLEPPQDSRQSYGRPPLDTPSRNFDVHLMTLIKGSFSLLDDDDLGMDSSRDSGSPKNCNKVIRVLTISEYKSQMSHLPESKTSMVMKCLEKIDCWDFDVWTIQDMTYQGALFYTAYALFLKWDLFRRLDIDEQIAINFFSQVEAGYHPNPYHNSVHGADVMHILHFILGKGKCKEALQLQDHDVMAMLVGGMIHDFDHPGLNNNFHIKIQSYLATLYNDRSMLENHHLAEVFDLVKTAKFNIFHSLSPQQFTDVRDTMVEVVLFTDMQLHAKILGNWKRRLSQNHKLNQKKEDQRLALSMCIKMADISNCCRPLDMYLKWSTQLVEEFFLQGDNEKARGDPVSPFMDRQQPYMGKSQVAFMNYVVVPMFESIAEFLPDMGFAVEIALSNVAYWKNQKEK